MSLDIHKQCAVCAWRAACAKKHTIEESSLHCADFTRDVAFGADDGAAALPERHKQVEDVFGTRKR